jgi:HK97 family phage prohead protease
MPTIRLGAKSQGDKSRGATYTDSESLKEFRYFLQPMTVTPQNRAGRYDSEYAIEGLAATFDTPYVLWVDWNDNIYYEQIDRHALDEADMSDIIMQYNHGGNVLARTSNNTLAVEAGDDGLRVCADLSKSSAAKNLYEEIKNGLVTKMSWAFTVRASEYDRKSRTLTITKVARVYDVSAVAYPANPETEISARADGYEQTIGAGIIARLRRESLERAISLEKIHLMLAIGKGQNFTGGIANEQA